MVQGEIPGQQQQGIDRPIAEVFRHRRDIALVLEKLRIHR
jgi:hypothetical protein